MCQTLRTRHVSLEDTNMKNDYHRWNVTHLGHGMYLWKTQTWRTVSINKCQTLSTWNVSLEDINMRNRFINKCQTLSTWNVSLEDINMRNNYHWWYVKHWRQGVYLWKTQSWRTMITDDMSNIEDKVFTSGRHNHDAQW